MWGHVTYFWNFKTPLISRERLKIETSNLARRRRAVSSVTHYWNFGTPHRAQTMSFRYELGCKGHRTENAQHLVT